MFSTNNMSKLLNLYLSILNKFKKLFVKNIFKNSILIRHLYYVVLQHSQANKKSKSISYSIYSIIKFNILKVIKLLDYKGLN